MTVSSRTAIGRIVSGARRPDAAAESSPAQFAEPLEF
jgi:hypothetical protein